MSVRSFLDTNVLVYADDARDRTKQRKAIDLIAQLGRKRSAVVSTQVLQEYFVTTTGKLKTAVARAQRKIELFGRVDLVTIDLPMILTAIDLHRLHAIPLWDGLIVAAAQRGGCAVLYTEDLDHGRKYGPVQIVNPFL
jgi:predicted nucleic acid-binding protein